jgi:tetratricopeptide (TPR) repeat protein
MAYQDIYSNHLNNIIELVNAEKITGANEALDKFRIYLDTIQGIGDFNAAHWRNDWRKKIWKLGELFKKRNPQQFLKATEEKLADETTTNKEVIQFIRSEIAFNFLPHSECKIQLQELIALYPLNPEFRNTLGHYYGREGKLLESIEEYKLAFKIDPQNITFLENRFSKDQAYLNELIKKGEYQSGKDYLQTLFADEDYLKAANNIRTSFVDFLSRFNDHLIFHNKLQQLEEDFKSRMHNELDSERKRIIEVLGFFSAIVAFILSTVSIGKNFSFIEATYFIVALGIILILFAVALSTLFTTSKTELLKDRKFWILVVGLILLFLFVVMTNSIVNILQQPSS